MPRNPQRPSDLIHDWNLEGAPPRPDHPIALNDETLRDGLQGPSVVDPPIETKKKILRAMDHLGIDTADVGLPGAGPRAVADVTALCQEIARSRLRLRPNCAARTVVRDIEPIARIASAVGIPIEACLFIGSSAIRQYTEGWTIDTLLKHTEEAVTFAVRQGLPVMYVTEDTARADPETIRRLYTTAIECGAQRICVTDTVGHATPHGAAALIRFVRSIVEATGTKVGIDWHGHRDRGLDVPNTLAAIVAGAGRVHGCGLGIGERAGNTAMDLILVNLKLLGWIDRDLTGLGEYCRLISEGCRVPIPFNYPVLGHDAFETGTGVHAAAVIKALHKKDVWLADRVYSGVPASDFGFAQRIRIGPLSGRSNVVFWLEQRGIEPKEPIVDRIFEAAKRSDRVLEDQEIRSLLEGNTQTAPKEARRRRRRGAA
ncbi:MAG TPA: LeuA family protein [Candidatus Polarisedimenticolia bacterium]|nr:LeuA family protein [Candidatus Polarisedimenticolia bacterium]